MKQFFFLYLSGDERKMKHASKIHFATPWKYCKYAVIFKEHVETNFRVRNLLYFQRDYVSKSLVT